MEMEIGTQSASVLLDPEPLDLVIDHDDRCWSVLAIPATWQGCGAGGTTSLAQHIGLLPNILHEPLRMYFAVFNEHV